MHIESRHLSQQVDCPAERAYSFMRDPRNLSAWAAGVGDMAVEFVAENPYGVLDHRVVLPDGTAADNHLRVLPWGDGCEVVFTLRERPGMTPAELDADEAAVRADLTRLKEPLEQPGA